MKLRNFFLCAALLSVIACQSWVYRPDVEQGNRWEDVQVQKLNIGMSMQEVQRILGDPLLQDPFQPERWDYIHIHKIAKEPVITRRLTLYFKDARLVRIEDAAR